ncbi:MAG: toll/interleukin-1 receptor domain-containing protein [Armatimonadetes bacterium]|nr:toll/interleukin-1 receptor domain-containing protein [Armatimonadota bacterium]
MATLRDYFDTDNSDALRLNNQVALANDQHSTLDIPVRMHVDFPSHAKHLSFFIACEASVEWACVGILENLAHVISIFDAINIEQGYLTDIKKSLQQIPFTNNVTFYVDQFMNLDLKERLHQLGGSAGIFVQLRDRNYVAARLEIERPVAFISYDSRDKDEIARPIAFELVRRMQMVWFDEFSLKVGDSLRGSIEKGLKECGRCILILSKNFLSNEGWTKTEFNSIFTREIIEKQYLVLPVWVDVTQKDVYEYSPSLADRFATNWSKGVENVAAELTGALLAERQHRD